MREYEYISHTGKSIKINNGTYFADFTPLRRYSAQIAEMNSSISSVFFGGINSAKIEISAKGKTEAEAGELADDLIDTFNSDLSAGEYGLLKINGYTMPCYFSAAESTAKFRNAKILSCDIVSDSWIWSKETKTVVFQNVDNVIIGTESESTALSAESFPHGFPNGFANPSVSKTIENLNKKSSQFRLIIYGSANAPAITIGGNTYAVSTVVQPGERLIIDSQKKTIKLVTAAGAETNRFNDRSDEFDVFAPIQPGTLPVSWDGSSVSKFMLTLIDERRFPPWND